ncbi:MAG: ribose 5-phosphate isomerase B [Bacteroidota bacterium]|nr:ribose 5-phosphate isomerase B [Bacteroidota bacterium]
MKISIANDHAGYELKIKLKKWLEENNYQVNDIGTHSTDSADYPDFAHDLARVVESGNSALGLLICGSGNGVAITANKHQGIRAALAWNEEVAALARQHNNANVLALPARFISEEEAIKICAAYLNATFEGGRHQRRVEKIGC